MKPSKEVPIPKNANGVLRNNPLNHGRSKRNGKTEHLFLGQRCTSDRLMHGSNRHGGSRSGGEDEAEFTGDIHNEEFTDWYG